MGFALPIASTREVLEVFLRETNSERGLTVSELYNLDFLYFRPCLEDLGRVFRQIVDGNDQLEGGSRCEFQEGRDVLFGREDDCQMGVVDAIRLCQLHHIKLRGMNYMYSGRTRQQGKRRNAIESLTD